METKEAIAERLYPEFAKEAASGYAYGPSDYTPMIEDYGAVAIRMDDDDYSGDTRILYEQPDGRIGVLIFGWGSCSGCDALQGSNSISELADLIEETRKEVQWFNSKPEALKWFQERDWPGQYSWHEEETKRFVEQAIEYLGGSPR